MIYLDHQATTPVDPRVLEAMMPYLTDKFGNASSIDHVHGNEAAAAVDTARKQIAELIGGESEEIVFTSGATESDNTALLGVAGKHFITTRIEHKAVLEACAELERRGAEITYLSVDKNGQIDLKDLERAIREDTVLISICAANNEIGSIAPLQEIGQIAKRHNILFHTDAAQAIGHIPLNVKEMNISLMSVSGHKIYGPKGIGALYIRKGVELAPLFFGGGQERGIRPGTLNVSGIVGFGAASEIAQEEMDGFRAKARRLSKLLLDGLKSAHFINGGEPKLAHNINLYLPGIKAKALLNLIKKDISISAGSACTTDDVKPSHVLLALGFDEERAFSSIRIGLGRFTTEKEIDKVISVISGAISRLKSL